MVYEYEVKKIDGSPATLAEYSGQVLLIVNTASECGFTPQYEELETLYEKYREQGFTVLGFPCNQFGGQESGSNADIQSFCLNKFSIRFPMFEKIEVNGAHTHPLFQYLKKQAPGVLGTEAIKWNFTKFLVSRDGTTIKRYPPTTKPLSLTHEIEIALKS